MKFNHAASLSFDFNSENEVPNGKELLDALKNAIASLNENNVLNAIEIFDSFELDEGFKNNDHEDDMN
jgi:hypothetical protein